MAIVLNGTTGITNDGGYTGDGVVFADTTPANTLVTDTSGNVGIGTTAPDARLSISYSALGSGGANNNTLRSGFGLTGAGASQPLSAFRFTNVYFTGIGGTNYANQWVTDSANCLTTEIVNTGATPIIFGTSATERARIDSSGNLLVGTTSANGRLTVSASANSTPAGSFTQTSGSYNNTVVLAICNTTGSTNYNFFYGYDAGAGTGKFQVFGTGTVQNATGSYGAFSDVKLKENIADATPKLADLMRVRIRNYNLKSDQNKIKQIGVVAQELEQVFPNMVEESPDRDGEGNDLGTTTKGVKYSVFVPMLIKAIQEQQAIITALTARVTALEGA